MLLLLGLGEPLVCRLDGRGEVALLTPAGGEVVTRLDRGEDLPEEAWPGATRIGGLEDVGEKEQRLVELPASVVDLRRTQPHLDLQLGVARAGRQSRAWPTSASACV
jgi:hypothetical protein